MPEFVHNVVEAIWSFLPSTVHNMIPDDTVHANSGEPQNSSTVGESTQNDSMFNSTLKHKALCLRQGREPERLDEKNSAQHFVKNYSLQVKFTFFKVLSYYFLDNLVIIQCIFLYNHSLFI
jgi:hypothetical protein